MLQKYNANIVYGVSTIKPNITKLRNNTDGRQVGNLNVMQVCVNIRNRPRPVLCPRIRVQILSTLSRATLAYSRTGGVGPPPSGFIVMSTSLNVYDHTSPLALSYSENQRALSDCQLAGNFVP